MARPDAQLIAVGKRCRQLSTDQRFINRALVEAAQHHAVVVRLKGGDPMIFGRAQEEIAALQAAGIAYEIVPGITSALAAAAELGVSLTRRGVSRNVVFVTPRVGEAESVSDWAHAMWLYYWLASYGINPLKDVKTITVPPPQMVANMRIGNMDGFCVGEPWNNRAIYDKIGFTAATTQDIWKDHPEKVLGCTAEFSQKYPNTARALIMAVLEASKYIDDMAHRHKVAEIIADKSYVNCPLEVIDQRLEGRYEDGLGKKWNDANYMKFYNGGAVNFPYLSDGMWFLTQHKRWGLLKEDPDYLAVAKKINQIELYKQAASQVKVPVPKDVMRTSKLIDGTVWDGKDPKKYAASFKVRA